MDKFSIKLTCFPTTFCESTELFLKTQALIGTQFMTPHGYDFVKNASVYSLEVLHDVINES